MYVYGKRVCRGDPGFFHFVGRTTSSGEGVVKEARVAPLVPNVRVALSIGMKRQEKFPADIILETNIVYE
jgi:hypothetical protein